MLVVEEKNVPWTVRVVTPIALWAMTLLAIPHDIDTLTVWTVNLYIGHSILLYEQGQRCHSISMSTHLKHHPHPLAALAPEGGAACLGLSVLGNRGLTPPGSSIGAMPRRS